MFVRDFLQFTAWSIFYQRTRSLLTILGIAVGIAAVIILTSIGKGLHGFVLAEFTQFGTNLIAINPGKVTTMGTPLGILGSVRPLTMEDAQSLRKISRINAVVPALQGNAEVEAANRRRRVTVYGVGPEVPEAFSMKVCMGKFLPPDNPIAPRALAVLGSKLRRELFGVANPLGRRIRVGGYRYRVIGVMESKGQVLGTDLDDTVFIPAARALELFNREGLMEIDVLYAQNAPVDEVVASIRRILAARHGREDFTITTQQQMLDVLDSVLNILTFAAGGLGGISLLVGGVGILTIMTIAVRERTAEIGLLRALGATRSQVMYLVLGEAVVLAAMGGLAGLVSGIGCVYLLNIFFPALPTHIPWLYVLLAECLASAIGLTAGAFPARYAIRLNPVDALRFG